MDTSHEHTQCDVVMPAGTLWSSLPELQSECGRQSVSLFLSSRLVFRHCPDPCSVILLGNTPKREGQHPHRPAVFHDDWLGHLLPLGALLYVVEVM